MFRLSWNALEFTSRVEQDISLVRFAHSWDILANTRNKFHISAHPCIILYLTKSSLKQHMETSYSFIPFQVHKSSQLLYYN